MFPKTWKQSHQLKFNPEQLERQYRGKALTLHTIDLDVSSIAWDPQTQPAGSLSTVMCGSTSQNLTEKWDKHLLDVLPVAILQKVLLGY